MKKTILLSIAIVLLGLSSFAQWNAQTSGTTNFIASVFFVNADTGYVSADGGVILKTTDGGVNWILNQPQQTICYIASLFLTPIQVMQ